MSGEHHIHIVTSTSLQEFGLRLKAQLNQLHGNDAVNHVSEPLFGMCPLTISIQSGSPILQYTAIIHTIDT